jgi:hypothetical protein
MVLLHLADHAAKDGKSCRPSVDRLAKRCGMNRTTVMSAVAALEGLGWLVRVDIGMADLTGRSDRPDPLREPAKNLRKVPVGSNPSPWQPQARFGGLLPIGARVGSVVAQIEVNPLLSGAGNQRDINSLSRSRHGHLFTSDSGQAKAGKHARRGC